MLCEQVDRLGLFQIFVPFEIRGGGADTDDVRAAIAIQVGGGARGSGHAPIVERKARPAFASRVVGAVDVDAASLSTKAGDDLVGAIAVEVGGHDGVAIDQSGIDHFALPTAVLLAVYHDLVSMPRLDRGKETRFS